MISFFYDGMVFTITLRFLCVYYIIDGKNVKKNIQGILYFNNEFQMGSTTIHFLSKICMYLCILYTNLKLTKQ